MKRLIHLFFISIILFYSNNLLSQDIGIQLDRNLGVIESVFIMHGKTVFELDSANNNIKNIYVFSDDSLSERFLQDPVLISDLEEAWNCIEVLSYILILTEV